MSSPEKVQQGLDVLKRQLIKNAPEYFSTETPEGRAALIAALVIAGGEFTQHLPEAVHDPNILYVYSAAGPRGWAQFTSDHHVFHSSVTPQEYDRHVGRILHGEIVLPRGTGRFPIRDFANRLENGELRTREDIMRYLRENIHVNDWNAIHFTSAELNIFTNRVIEHAYRGIYGRELGQPALAQSHTMTRTSGGSRRLSPELTFGDLAYQTQRTPVTTMNPPRPGSPGTTMNPPTSGTPGTTMNPPTPGTPVTTMNPPTSGTPVTTTTHIQFYGPTYGILSPNGISFVGPNGMVGFLGPNGISAVSSDGTLLFLGPQGAVFASPNGNVGYIGYIGSNGTSLFSPNNASPTRQNTTTQMSGSSMPISGQSQGNPGTMIRSSPLRSLSNLMNGAILNPAQTTSYISEEMDNQLQVQVDRHEQVQVNRHELELV